MTADKKSIIYKEKAEHGTPSFPFGFYEVFPDDSWDGIKHHWHEEIEIIYFEKGRGELKINTEPFSVDSDSFFFINSGELHSAAVDGPCRESAVLFQPRMLCFDTYDSSQSRLLQPLIRGELSFPHSLNADHPAYPAIKNEYLDIAVICRDYSKRLANDISSQLFLKAGLLKILAILSSYNLIESCTADNYKVQPLKTVLAYIRSHYQEKLYIRDLAGQINMNEQYFCRFFKDSIGQSPIAYLNEYRIRQAILLLQDTDASVMDISLHCGFNNFGNFLREFKKSTNTTPLKYRQDFLSGKSKSEITKSK